MLGEDEKIDDTEQQGIKPSGESGVSLNLLGEDIETSGEDEEEDTFSATSDEQEDARSASRAIQEAGTVDSAATKSTHSSHEHGKPPRPPQVSRATSTPNHVELSHRRVPSTNSGLTDDEDVDIDIPLRQRSVSWDVDKVLGEGIDPSLAIPMYRETIRTANPPPPPMTPPVSTPPVSTPPAARAAKHRWGMIRESINMVQAVNPMESEAETAILRILDKAKKRDAADEHHIMPHVPPDSVNSFHREPSVEAPLSSKSDMSMGGETTTTSMRARQKGHKRTKTLESKLFELGTQLDRLQYDQGDQQARQRVFSHDLQAETNHGNSGDALVKNAAKLFGGKPGGTMETIHQEQEEEPLIDSGRSQLASSTEPANRKDDSGVMLETGEPIPVGGEIEVDVEVGVDEAHAPDENASTRAKFGLFKAGKDAVGAIRRAKREVREDFGYFWKFLQPRSGGIKTFLAIVVFGLIVPGIAVAAILFHTGNPDLGREGASTSWLILFLTRQAVTFILAKATELFIIDFLSLQMRVTVRIFGPIVTLLVVQSKGYPFIVFSWGVFNLGLNSGEHVLAQHWLFWQELMPMFNANNPSGTITFSRMNYLVNGTAVVFGLIVAIKRLWWGLWLGKRSYLHYGDELAIVVKNMVLVSEVAALSKDIEIRGNAHVQVREVDLRKSEAYNALRLRANDSHVSENESSVFEDASMHSVERDGEVIDTDRRDELTDRLSHSQRLKLEALLGRWEEPETVGDSEREVSIGSILQFRQMLTYMDLDYPFSLAYGPADSREACVESAQEVYERLTNNKPKDGLSFETIAVIATTKGGDIDTEKMKDLLRLFRPDRDGLLTALDFVKGCDSVYKQMRLLRASILNSGQIDRAFEVIMNFAFFTIVWIIILAIFDFDPLALFLAVSGIVLAFAFMISSASSKYFEGILFILVRRPYDIGDRIAVGNVEEIANSDGSASWFVQNVDLFSTTVRYGTTNEVATLANGSLASSRVINAKRSPQATVYVYMKFGVGVTYSRIMVFRKAVEAFVRDRPREWRNLSGFRATRVVNEQGFIEYVLVLVHRESWQDIGVILQSKADVASFCLEVSRKLNMTYMAPPLPVNLSLAQPDLQLHMEQVRSQEAVRGVAQDTISTPSSPDVESIARMFDQKG